MDFLFLDGSPDLMGHVAKKLTDKLKADKEYTFAFDSQVNGTAESWNRVMITDLVCLMASRDSSHDVHVV